MNALKRELQSQVAYIFKFVKHSCFILLIFYVTKRSCVYYFKHKHPNYKNIVFRDFDFLKKHIMFIRAIKNRFFRKTSRAHFNPFKKHNKMVSIQNRATPL